MWCMVCDVVYGLIYRDYYPRKCVILLLRNECEFLYYPSESIITHIWLKITEFIFSIRALVHISLLPSNNCFSTSSRSSSSVTSLNNCSWRHCRRPPQEKQAAFRLFVCDSNWIEWVIKKLLHSKVCHITFTKLVKFVYNPRSRSGNTKIHTLFVKVIWHTSSCNNLYILSS